MALHLVHDLEILYEEKETYLICKVRNSLFVSFKFCLSTIHVIYTITTQRWEEYYYSKSLYNGRMTMATHIPKADTSVCSPSTALQAPWLLTWGRDAVVSHQWPQSFAMSMIMMIISCSFPRTIWHFFYLFANTICTLLVLHWFVIPHYIYIYYICFVLHVLTAWLSLSALKMCLPMSSYAPSATIPHFSALLHSILCTQFQPSHLHQRAWERLYWSHCFVSENFQPLSYPEFPWYQEVQDSWQSCLTVCLSSILTGELIAYFTELTFCRCWKYFLTSHF